MHCLSILSLLLLTLFVSVTDSCAIPKKCDVRKMCKDGKCIGVGLIQFASLLRQQQAKRSGEKVMDLPIVIPEW